MSFKIDMSKFKKISSDKHHTMLRHDDGHVIKIAHGPLSLSYRKQLEKLPMADGGEAPKVVADQDKRKAFAEGFRKATKYAEGGQASKEKPVEEKKMPYKQDPEKAKKFAEAFRKATGYAKGGKVDHRKLDIEEIKEEPKKKLEIEELEQPVPKDPIDYEPVKMADGGEMADSQESPTDSQALPEKIPVNININTAPGAPAPLVAQQEGMIPSSGEASVHGEMEPPKAPEAVAPSPEAPSMPAQAVPPASPAPQMPTAMGGFEKQASGIQQEAEAQQQLAKAQEPVLQEQARAAQDLMSRYQDHFNALDSERKAFQDDIINKEIDPGRYLGSMDLVNKALTAIAIGMGGIGGALTHQENPALKYLNSQIDRDIDAQKAELGKKETLLSANLRQFGNLRDATDMTRVMQMDMVMAKLKEAAAKAQSPLAKANASKMLGALEMQIAPTMQQLATRQALASHEGGLIKEDPAMFVPLMVPSDKQKEVFGQIEAAQNTKHMANSILKAFDQAAKENTVLRTGAGLLRTPASVLALHQAMQPTFKDLEGTVRQAAMDNTFKNVTPMPGDLPSTVADKRKALEQYLQSKASAPMAKGYGIDLEKFESTAAKPESKLSPKELEFVRWARENPKDPRAILVLKKLGLE